MVAATRSRVIPAGHVTQPSVTRRKQGGRIARFW